MNNFCLKLPLFFNGEQCSILEDLGINNTELLSEKEVVYGTFYNIDCVMPYMVDGIEYSEICCNGRGFICTLNTDEVNKMILEKYRKS